MGKKYLQNEIEFRLMREVVQRKIKNKDKNWFKFVRNFTNQGKQGVVGIVKDIESSYNFVYKMSQYINYLAKHEALIMNSLNEIAEFCPHFCKILGETTTLVDANYRKKKSPLHVSTKHPIESEIFFMEQLSSNKLYNIIKDTDISDEALYSTIKQVLLGIGIAQNKKKFTHYDLHSCNIMMQRCNRNSVFLYILDDHNQFCVPTYGYYPILIDFGFSYVKDMESRPIWSTLAHTDVGFMTNQFDQIADPKLFLVTISDEMQKYRKANLLRKVIRNVFEPLNIDWESGWDIYNTPGAAEFITEAVEDISVESKIFSDYNAYCMDIVQGLIDLPIKNRTTDSVEISYKLFVNEFEKFENEIGSSLFNLYLLKCIVNVAKEVRVEYENPPTRISALRKFKEGIITASLKVADYCDPKDVKYEKLLCGLLVFSKCAEGILYKALFEKCKGKVQQYEKLKLKTPEQIYGAVEINIPHNYEFINDTEVFVFDAKNECRSHFKMEDYKFAIEELNETHPLMQGTLLYDIYSGNYENSRNTSSSHSRSSSRRSTPSRKSRSSRSSRSSSSRRSRRSSSS